MSNKDQVTVRYTGSKPAVLGGELILPGETRVVRRQLVIEARVFHPDSFVVQGDQPAQPEPAPARPRSTSTRSVKVADTGKGTEKGKDKANPAPDAASVSETPAVSTETVEGEADQPGESADKDGES